MFIFVSWFFIGGIFDCIFTLSEDGLIREILREIEFYFPPLIGGICSIFEVRYLERIRTMTRELIKERYDDLYLLGLLACHRDIQTFLEESEFYGACG